MRIELKALVQWDEDYKEFVATCLESGAVATGKSTEEAVDGLTQVLTNDTRIVVESGRWDSLFRVRAGEAVWVAWYELRTQICSEDVREAHPQWFHGALQPRESLACEVFVLWRQR